MPSKKIYFRNEEHRERFKSAVQGMSQKAIYDGDRLDEEYAPALLVLTASGAIWEKMKPHINGGIHFDQALSEEFFSTTEQTMVRLAANIFNPALEGPSPVDLVPLDARNFEVCVQAMRMRRSPYQLADIEV